MDAGHYGGEALRSVIERLLCFSLRPRATYGAWHGGQVRLISSWTRQRRSLAAESPGRGRQGRGVLRRRVALGTRPSPETLARADSELSGAGRDRLELRYLPSLDAAKERLQSHSPDVPIAHLAVICGLTAEGMRLQIESQELDPPPQTSEALFAPRVWIRPNSARNMLLAPPATTPAGNAWLRLMTALYDTWPEPGGKLRLPELRTTSADLGEELRVAHDLALWVATLDPYATRDSLHQALGEDVAILHQERRLGGESPYVARAEPEIRRTRGSRNRPKPETCRHR